MISFWLYILFVCFSRRNSQSLYKLRTTDLLLRKKPQLTSRVDNSIILAFNLRPLDLGVALADHLRVDMQAREL